MKRTGYIQLLLTGLLFSACTKVIDPKVGNDPDQLNIEANLTNINTVQYVLLRKSISLSNTNNYPPVTGATVAVSASNGNTYAFTETQPGIYASIPFGASEGVTYTLHVQANEQTYTATSIMPATVIMDSLSSKNRPLNKPKDGRDQKVISVYYQDPAGIANQYRFIERVNGVQVKSVFVYDDQLTDGRYVTFELLEQDIDIYAGDTVEVEMQCIDKPVYTYWFALQSQQSNNFNGAVAPANPLTNISPQTLGYFSAHTSQTISFRVK
jgi:hypothetical protein